LTGAQPSYADMPVGTFLDALCAGTPAPAAGSAAALVLAQAAALCAKAARLSSRQLTADRAARLFGEAEQIRSRAASLIDEDPRAYQAVIEQTRGLGGQSRGGTSDAGPADGLAAALSAAADVPMQVVELAVPVASIAAVLAESGKPALRGDAMTAGLLAQAAARAAAVLVRVNLAGVPSDPRHARADAWIAAIDERVR
jgi:methenyltetrahydrofolate cyclohydrolase